MKICIPTQDDLGLESQLFGHFGSAPFFAIVEVDSGDLQVMGNLGLHSHPRGCHHVDELRAHDIDAVACAGLGRQAFAGLQEAGIDVLIPERGTIGEILEALRLGQLRKLSADEVCGGGRPGGAHGAGRGHGRGHCCGDGHGHDHSDRPVRSMRSKVHL